MTPLSTIESTPAWGARATRRRVRRAMPRGELALYCQPTVDAMSGRIVGGEALIRWRHPRRGLLLPSSWLPAVEAGSLSPAFNLHVMELAIAHHAAWEGQDAAVPLSVNVTPDCFADAGFVDGLARLARQRPPSGAIRLEVTERATIAGHGQIDESIARLRRLGFDFLLDDFGADHSSLSRLATLPFTMLKLDASLVRPMAQRHSHRLVVAAAIQMSHALGLSVVGEGVEDVQTWSLLQALGCDLIQGFVVARPMPAENFPAFAAAHVATPPHTSHAAPWQPRRGERRREPDRRQRPWAAPPAGIERRSGGERRQGPDPRLAAYASGRSG